MVVGVFRPVIVGRGQGEVVIFGQQKKNKVGGSGGSFSLVA